MELRHVGKHEDLVDLGVVLDGGRKIVLKTESGLIRPFEWVSEEEAEQFSKEGRLICPRKETDPIVNARSLDIGVRLRLRLRNHVLV